MKRVPIEMNMANALNLLGSLYRNPADALKEHISNAIDEHVAAKRAGKAVDVCMVSYNLEKDRITIEYPYGMTAKEFEDALQRVADSVKEDLDVTQIGQLGIGMFSFFQIAGKCTFFTKKEKASETVRVTIRKGSDKAEFDTSKKREALRTPGIRIIISDLKFDPTKPRGLLSSTRLQKVFAEKFDPYLRSKSLQILIRCKGKTFHVEPIRIDLPPVGESYKNWPLTKDQSKRFNLELFFNPSGKGVVAIRHKGVPIIDDIKNLSAYGLEESIYANGDLKGYIDADFLTPLPARTEFEPNEDWENLLIELDRLLPSIEAEVELLREIEEEKKLSEVQKKAIQLAREILNTEEFEDLELLEGFGRKLPEPRVPPNGFDFVPSSIRIRPGKIGSLPLKAYVPKKVPDNSLIRLTLRDSSSVRLKTEELKFKSSEADENGLVTHHVLLEGLSETTDPATLIATTGALKPAVAKIRVAKQKQTREPLGPGERREGLRITYEEVPFEEGLTRHSRYVSRIIQINELNPDYKREVKNTKSKKSQLAYATLMIGKETVSYNDKSGTADEYLERLLSFYFRLKNRL